MSEVQTRRRLRKMISEPLEAFYKDKWQKRLIFVEDSHKKALLTRAAIGMYIGRHDMELTTKVDGNEIWVMKDRDILEPSSVCDWKSIGIIKE